MSLEDGPLPGIKKLAKNFQEQTARNTCYELIFLPSKSLIILLVKKGVALTILVSLPVVSFTYLVLTDEADVNVFSESFFRGLEKTQELVTKLQTKIEEKIDELLKLI